MKRIIASLLLVFALLARVPTLAAEVTTTQQYTSGQQVQSTDLAGDIEAFRNLSGILATLMLGTPNALPNNNPLAVSLSGSALNFSIGGVGQFVIAQDVTTSGNARIIDSCPQQTITIPANTSGFPRTDTLAIQYQQIPTNGHNVTFSDGSVRTVYNALEGCGYSYNVGTTTVPTGYVAFAHLLVPPSASVALGSVAVTYLFSNVSTLLQAAIGGVVSTLNGANGNLTVTGGAGISVSASGNTITVSSTVTTTPVSSLQGQSGAVTLQSADSSIAITNPSAGIINLKANFPATVNEVNFQTGNVTIAGGTGINVSTSAGTVTVTNTGVTLLNGQYNSVGITSNNGSVAVNTTAGDIDLGTNFIYDVANSTFRPTGRACVGTATTNSSSLITVTCGTTVLSGVASFYDSTFSNSIIAAVKGISGNSITFGTRYTNTNAATGAGIGLYYTVFAF